MPKISSVSSSLPNVSDPLSDVCPSQIRLTATFDWLGSSQRCTCVRLLAKIKTRPCRSGPLNTDIYKSFSSCVQSQLSVSSVRTRIVQGNVVKRGGLMAREMFATAKKC